VLLKSAEKYEKVTGKKLTISGVTERGPLTTKGLRSYLDEQTASVSRSVMDHRTDMYWNGNYWRGR
jgi:hypothetical protein